ncbi:Rhodanese-like protein [Guyanagaster necrorhizus]|uniref:Rhodanese-like protein n=1 Tax=Guyanagaster necrorhizus TaxID=856835 RepID=A0A9P7W0S0_9AGAR|nr:Rhodanese-like protein [Guyanagaster necrorhizus MCA 3950]KAG7450280.1 Rhodanese-like protein [Guyanagaster necrorhizus MCA 3950]
MLFNSLLKGTLRIPFSRFASSSNVAPLILSPLQLREMLHSKTLVSVLDASWFMPNSPRNAKSEFIAKRIPGSQFLDLDEVASSHQLGLKHMMPTERVFADACERFGIEPASHVVIYDSHGIFSSPRALFMFRSFGHTNSSIVNGGLPLWEDLGFPIEDGPASEPEPAEYPAPMLDVSTIRNYEQMVANSALDPQSVGADVVLDARSRGRFTGADPEPRPGLESGHIPRSFSLPFNVFLEQQSTASNPIYTTLRPIPEIRQALVDAVGEKQVEAILKGDASVVTTCGSGMTAAVLWLGLKLLGAHKVGLYDESWTGYAMRGSSKIEKTV